MRSRPAFLALGLTVLALLGSAAPPAGDARCCTIFPTPWSGLR